ncbi:Csu type fimbrial protein [Rhizobium halophytocola]|uniref:Spore coat protein U-like protein n=1 Tax=Rhizobium halophytocola TaxID=735519 RepID=A0ABS4E3T2_9HYPH|nr:spore coat U domain-containing protein [Rhizobium halophytocola]MBP1852592.1 spore coat protein U-like protein [Rhizobium halophytocola]
MTKYMIAAATVAVALPLSLTTAFAATKTANMGVSMTIADECTISTDTLAFGTVSVLDAAADATGNITVKCTAGATYQIGLSAGSGDLASVATRYMTNTSDTSVKAAYSIYQDSGHTTVWGNTPGTDTVGNTATGDDETIPFYGQVNAGQSIAAGDYADTIVATITY